MKLKYWLIITGPSLLVLLVLFALSPEDYFDSEDSIWISSDQSADSSVEDILTPKTSKPQSSSSDATALYPSTPGGTAPDTPKMLTVAQLQPQPQTTTQPSATKFEQAPRVKFAGPIQQISEFQKRDGQIHIWVHDNGVEKEISVAPSWFLEHLGCSLGHDMQVSGAGFLFGDKAPDPLIYAKKIIVNKKTCRLRNDEGFALWSSRLR